MYLSLFRVGKSMLPWCWISCDATACWRGSVSVDKDSPTGSCSRSSSSATNSSLPTSSLKDSWTARRRARKWCVPSLRRKLSKTRLVIWPSPCFKNKSRVQFFFRNSLDRIKQEMCQSQSLSVDIRNDIKIICTCYLATICSRILII